MGETEGVLEESVAVGALRSSRETDEEEGSSSSTTLSAPPPGRAHEDAVSERSIVRWRVGNSGCPHTDKKEIPASPLSVDEVY